MRRTAPLAAPAAQDRDAAGAALARRRVSETYHVPLTRPRVAARERYHKLLDARFSRSPVAITAA